LPDFVVIGVVRGGTTWLWENLRYHPDVWLSPVKEISYFDRRFPIVPEKLGDAPVEPRSGKLFVERLKLFRWRRVGRYLRRATPANLAWQWRFYRCDLSDDWYRSLFVSAGDRMAGDITPHYSALGDEGVAHLTGLLPRAKLVLILRDPIARDWSAAVHFLSRYGRRPVTEISDEEFLAHFNDPDTRRRGDYLPMLERWTRAVPSERLLIGFHDQLSSDPVGLFETVCRFLEIDPDVRPPALERRINAAPRHPMPPHLHRYLAELHLPALEELAERFGPPVDRWLAEAERVLCHEDCVRGECTTNCVTGHGVVSLQRRTPWPGRRSNQTSWTS